VQVLQGMGHKMTVGKNARIHMQEVEPKIHVVFMVTQYNYLYYNSLQQRHVPIRVRITRANMEWQCDLVGHLTQHLRVSAML